MTDKEREQLKTILKRLRNTRPNETICLMSWEVSLLLKYIDVLIMKGAL